MHAYNHSTLKEFTLVGLSATHEIQPFLFLLFFYMYIVTVLGNVCIIITYRYSPSLHTPMYFYLANFSFLDLCYVSATAPKMLSDFLLEHKTISFYGCAIQAFCVLLFGGTECYMLAVMAYDRYNAICHPLLYHIIMNKMACIQHIASSWIIGAVISLIQTTLTFTLPFCRSNTIDHFFCDIPPILELACTDTWLNELVIYIVCIWVVIGSCMLTIISYTKIISAILNIHSSTGRKKAFSTCTSHLIVLIIFYGSCTIVYMTPKTRYETSQDRLISLLYTTIAPLLNPFIYSLRNSEVKAAFRKVLYHCVNSIKYH